MGDASWIIPVSSALLGGGFLAGISQLTIARAQSRMSRLQEPALVTSSSLGGAEQAIALMERALTRAESEIEDLKRDRDAERRRSRDKDDRISELERELISLRVQLSGLSNRLNATVQRVQEVKNEMDE